MALFSGRTVALRDDLADSIQQDLPTQAAEAVPRGVAEQEPWDEVDQASWDSFPASDAPPWTLGYPGPPAAGRAEAEGIGADPP